METGGRGAQSPSGANAEPGLTISDLAERTGMSVPTLRMWEKRHGFPTPVRLANGHRRYVEADVDVVRSVLRRQDAGVKLEAAITAARRSTGPAAPSVFAAVRRNHPHLEVRTLRKSTLLALSWAIEDEFCAQATHAVLYAAFQREEHYRRAETRWREIATYAASASVFADFERSAGKSRPSEVAVPRSLPLAREWAVVCDAGDLPVVLTGWELPGQGNVRPGDRLFESTWSVEGAAVRDAALVCADVGRTHGDTRTPADEEQERQILEGPVGTADARSVEALYRRIVAYVDRHPYQPV